MKPLLKRGLLLTIISWAFSPAAIASGARWVTGKPWYTWAGNPIYWYTDSPQYFTDPGDLSPYVNHAAADAIVAAAAAVWTIPTSRLNLLYGGALDEHASSANVYATGTGIVFPADIQNTNYLNKQIAILYDSDGSIIDLMLGTGASSPSSCRQNAVIESVDSFSVLGKIQHAILVLNGRCTGPAPEQQLQLQYQLMRAFGRIIGLSWSQTNDNVFTGNPRPTYQQALHWPIMHPIDVICGPYTYQCMPQPFTLRDDDISGLGLLYPVGTIAPSIPGKTDTLARGTRLSGTISFPNGQGMQGVNVVIHRREPFWNIPEDWESTSGVSGFRFRRNGPNPVTSPVTQSSPTNMGDLAGANEGYYDIFRTPLYDWEVWQDLIVSTQPINPLYVGAYAVGPYDTNSVLPSGSSVTQTIYVAQIYSMPIQNFTVTDAAPSCDTSQDGIESSPSAVSSSGWWTGNLCSYGHAAWSTLSIQSNRSITIEVTAQDENSLSSSAKMLPVIGIWNSTDATGTLPTIASTPAAFNSTVTGMTTLSAQTTQPQQLRIAIADQRGDGRPDFNYQARILYANSISPSTVPPIGGTVTITGMGFRPGNIVTVNGLPATVTSITSNTITATTPALHSATAITADVTVRDLTTGGTTTMTAALNYAAPQPTLLLLSAPSGQIFTNQPAASAFTLKALSGDGTTPLPNTPITLTSTASVLFNACAASTCTLTTDASGIVTTTVTPLTPGPITLTASSIIGSVTAAFNAIARIQTITTSLPTLYLAAGASFQWTTDATLSDNAASTIGLPIQWQPLSGPILLTPAVSTTDSSSTAQAIVTVSSLPANTQAIAQVCAWSPNICTNLNVTAIDPSQWQIDLITGGNQSINATDTFAAVTLRVHDSLGHPIAAAPITIHQTAEPWTTIPCPDQGRCPTAPIYSMSNTAFVSAVDGTITFPVLDLLDQPEITRIAVATGTQGFLSLTLQKRP